MKIICVGRNYVAHVNELNNSLPSEPVVFLKPDSAQLKNGKPFFYPEFSSDIHYEGELVLRIGKNGRHIREEFALNYVESATVGIDLTARDIQSELKSKGLPWELSKAFDHSAILGEFIQIDQLPGFPDCRFSLHQNGEKVQDGDTRHMIFSIPQIISFVSRYFFLKQGDLLFTGTPQGVGPISIGDSYEGYIDERKVLSCSIK